MNKITINFENSKEFYKINNKIPPPGANRYNLAASLL